MAAGVDAQEKNVIKYQSTGNVNETWQDISLDFV